MDLTAVYRRIPTGRTCDGCHRCAIRCAGSIPFAPAEWDAVAEYVAREISDERLARVLAEDKEFWLVEPPEGGWPEPPPLRHGASLVEVLTHRPEQFLLGRHCPLYDRAAERCMVYPVRPLVCRLLGFVEWMPCPAGLDLPVLADGPWLMLDYALLRPRPIDEWLAERPLVGRSDE